MGISNGWGYSAALAGINLFLWIVTIIKYRTAYLKNPAFSSRYIFVGFILILYSTFAFAEADTYHYEYIGSLRIGDVFLRRKPVQHLPR